MQVGVWEVKKTAKDAAHAKAFEQIGERAGQLLDIEKRLQTCRMLIVSNSTVQVLQYMRGCPTPLSDGQHHLEIKVDNLGLQCLTAYLCNAISE